MAPAAETSSPLLKADSAMLAFSANADGSLRGRRLGGGQRAPPGREHRTGDPLRAGVGLSARRAAEGAGTGPVSRCSRAGIHEGVSRCSTATDAMTTAGPYALFRPGESLELVAR
jgi:hypothetical protein